MPLTMANIARFTISTGRLFCVALLLQRRRHVTLRSFFKALNLFCNKPEQELLGYCRRANSGIHVDVLQLRRRPRAAATAFLQALIVK